MRICRPALKILKIIRPSCSIKFLSWLSIYCCFLNERNFFFFNFLSILQLVCIRKRKKKKRKKKILFPLNYRFFMNFYRQYFVANHWYFSFFNLVIHYIFIIDCSMENCSLFSFSLSKLIYYYSTLILAVFFFIVAHNSTLEIFCLLHSSRGSRTFFFFFTFPLKRIITFRFT